MKRCPKCGRTLPVSAFNRNRSAPDGYQTYCRDDQRRMQRPKKRVSEMSPDELSAHRARRRARYRSDGGKTRSRTVASGRRRRYGISPADYAHMLEQQHHACAVCFRPSDRPSKELDVDHNHATNEVRGLLDNDCNIALGKLGDDLNRVVALAAYLLAGPGFTKISLRVDSVEYSTAAPALFDGLES